MEPIGRRLNRLRKLKRLTMKEVSSRMGIPVSTYRDWEYGSEIKGEPYLQLASVLNVSLYELISGNRPENQDNLLRKLSSLRSQIRSIEDDVRTLF